MKTQFAEYGHFLRLPDLHLGDVRTRLVTAAAPFDLLVDEPSRSMLAFVRRGDLSLRLEHHDSLPIPAPAGMTIGFEAGRPHRWTSFALADGAPVELFISSIPQRMGVLQRLPDGMIILPPHAQPTARILACAVELHIAEFETGGARPEEAIIRRCAEICLMAFVRFAREAVAKEPSASPGLEHDEYLLRAWAAYFAEPRKRWSLAALAGAAGLGRTAFAERFRQVVGTPPLQTLRALRLQQAEAMLRESRAPLSEIAFSAGYDSEAAFIRAFHRHYGTTPGRRRAGEVRYITGFIELGSAILILVPSTAFFGALGLCAVCVGAFVAQLGPLHGDVIHVLVLGGLAAGVAWFSRPSR